MLENSKKVEDVRQVFQALQDGYTRRDRSQVDALMDAVVAPDEGVEIVGTGAIRREPGDDEWCLGWDAVRKLIDTDWEGWGDVDFCVASAQIFTLGDVAWLSTRGTVSMTIPLEVGSQNTLNAFKAVLEQPAPQPHMRLMELARRSTNALNNLYKGEKFVWPLRFTAVLVQRNGRWLFHQMHFSYPTTSFPDERL